MPLASARLLLNTLLILVLALAGAGQSFAAKPNRFRAVEILPGVIAPICHDGLTSGSGKGDGPGSHGCCDDCALLAHGLPADPATPVALPALVHVVTHASAISWSPRLARARSPRQAQGPPAA